MGPGPRGDGAAPALRRNAGGAGSLAIPLCLASLILASLLSGCRPAEVEPSDPELRKALGIPDEIAIHRINVGGRGGQVRFVPEEVDVESGEAVQFFLTDRRVHVIRFLEEEMDPGPRDFMEEMGQLRSPPLVDPGARFVVSFEGAPSGDYPFVSQGQQGPERGVVRVDP